MDTVRCSAEQTGSRRDVRKGGRADMRICGYADRLRRGSGSGGDQSTSTPERYTRHLGKLG